jgi:hypothetical protein
MSEQAARKAFYAWVDRLPFTTDVSAVRPDLVWQAAWAACEARVREQTLAEVEAQAEVLDRSPERIWAVRDVVQAVRAVREGQDGA